jgi:predicted metal-dependent phosphoesterase TrpH
MNVGSGKALSLTWLRLISGCLLAVAIVAGTMSDELNPPASIMLGGYRVLAVDFHVHASVFGDGAVAPWDMPREAQRQGLDAFALTSHNQVWTAKLGRWLARWTGGATVLVGEEVQSAHYHLIAVGIHRSVAWRQPAAAAIDDVHDQGGIAIAAHPVAQYSPGWDAAAIRKLDGSEIMHPMALFEDRAADLKVFYERGSFAAIGSSDYHGTGSLGICRTYVFARENSEAAIVEAVRAHRTVVFDLQGHPWGDPQMIRLAVEDGRLAKRTASAPDGNLLARLSRILGVLGLLVAMLAASARPIEAVPRLGETT